MGVATDDVDLERDRLLVQECQAGREAAFGQLYACYHQRIVRLCARRLGSHANAEDVAQEAFLRAWRAIGRLEGNRRFYPWLHVIASNACTDVLRRERPTTPLSELVGAAELEDGQWIEEQFATSFDATVAAEALQMVNERHRRVLHLREELEWSVHEIAAHEGLEPNAIDSLLWRARASLRRKYLQLSEGAAAVFGLGTMRLLSFRHRLARAVHLHQGPWTLSLPARAALAAVIAMGAGAAAAPLLSSPTPHQQPVVGRHAGTEGTGGVRPAVVAPDGTGPVVTPSAPAPTGDGPGAGTTTTSTGTGGTPAVPVGSAVQGGPLSSVAPLSATTPGAAGRGVVLAPSAVVATVAGVTGATVGGAAAIAVGAATAVGGAVQTAVGSPVLAPVVTPVLAPVSPVLQPVATGATAGGVGITLP